MGVTKKGQRTMHDQPKPPVRYESYLLRLCREERDGEPVCQAMLQNVSSKEQRYFADLEGLVAFLQAQSPGQGMAKPAAQGKEEETM
jgi:hypothetical protein